MPIVILILGKTTIVESTLMMISAKVIETSVIIADYLQSHRLRSTLTWKIKRRGPVVLLCSNFSLFNTNHEKGITWNSYIPCYTLIYIYQ